MDRMIIELGSRDGYLRLEVRFEDRRKPGQVIFLNRAGVTDLRDWLDGWLNEPQPVTVSIGSAGAVGGSGTTMGAGGGGGAGGACGGAGGSTDGGWNGAAGGGGGAG